MEFKKKILNFFINSDVFMYLIYLLHFNFSDKIVCIHKNQYIYVNKFKHVLSFQKYLFLLISQILRKIFKYNIILLKQFAFHIWPI